MRPQYRSHLVTAGDGGEGAVGEEEEEEEEEEEFIQDRTRAGRDS